MNPAETDISEDIEAESAAEPLICRFCDAPAVTLCTRCTSPYCERHGEVLCDACSAPASGLPSPRLIPLVAGAFVLGAALATWLLVAPPRLRGEHPPSAGSAPTAVASGRSGGQQPAGSAGTAAAAAPTVTPARRTHIVRQGDTLGAIAAQSGTTIDALRAANPGVNETALQLGQELVIP